MYTFPSEEAESYLCLTLYTILFCAWDFATSRVRAGSGSREVLDVFSIFKELVACLCAAYFFLSGGGRCTREG